MSTQHAAGALRMGMAIAISLFASMWLRLENPYWAPTTIIAVEGLNYGAVSGKLFKRFAGNVLGTLAGILLIALFSQTGPVYALACGTLTMLGIYAMLEGNQPHFWRWTVVAAGLVTLFKVDTPVMAFYLAMDRVCGVTFGLVAIALSHQLISPRFAGDDYRHQLDNMLKRLSDLAAQRAGQLIQGKIFPLLSPEEITGAMALLREELHHACLDTEEIRRKRNVHERITSLLDDLGGCLTLICADSPTGSLDAESLKCSADNLMSLSLRLNRLRSIFNPIKRTTAPDHDHAAVAPENTRATSGPWCHLISYALEHVRNLEKEAERLALPTGHADDEQYPTPPENEAVSLSEPLHNAWIAILSGAAMALGMVAWRETGWPGGSAIPLLAALQIIYCAAGPALSLSFLVIIQIVALMFSTLLLFFVLPAIQSGEFFFMVIVALFTFWGLLMHSPSPKLRGLGLLIAILMNSCAYSYTATAHSFQVITSYAWCMVGGTLLSGLLMTFFYPVSPGRRFATHASGFLKQIRQALNADSTENAAESLRLAGRHAHHMQKWALPASRGMKKDMAGHTSMAALSARSLSTALCHEIESGKEIPRLRTMAPWVGNPATPGHNREKYDDAPPHVTGELFRIFNTYAGHLNRNSAAAQ